MKAKKLFFALVMGIIATAASAQFSPVIDTAAVYETEGVKLIQGDGILVEGVYHKLTFTESPRPWTWLYSLIVDNRKAQFIIAREDSGQWIARIFF